MPLPVEFYLNAVSDLAFTDQPHRIGTCPACGKYGFTLKLLEWPDRRREYEPFCPNGSPLAINEAVLAVLDAVKAA